MNTETKETLNKVAEYAEQKKVELKKKMAGNCTAALILLIFCMALDVTEGFGGFIAQRPYDNIVGFTMGLTMVILLFNILFLTGKMENIQNWKKKMFHRN